MINNAVLTLARSKLQQSTKKLCALEFNDDIDEIIDFLRKINPDILPDKEYIKQENANILKNKCEIISINDNKYPKLLKQTYLSPLMLSVKGNIDFLSSNTVAFVGSRTLDDGDVKIIHQIVKSINEVDVGVVSGLAYGSDIVAHIQSISTGTIAVMPCGFKYCYPKEHQEILDKIIDFGGIAISEFPFEEPPKQQNFIKRNATIVGLANSVIIARARSRRSGTMSSANFATKFNKNIYTLHFLGKNDGNEYLLDNNIANEITNLEELKYSILIDIANNENLVNNSDIILNTSSKENTKQSFLFSHNEGNSIANEVGNILLYSEKCQNIKKNESELQMLYQICCKELQPNDIEKREILKVLLEITLKI